MLASSSICIITRPTSAVWYPVTFFSSFHAAYCHVDLGRPQAIARNQKPPCNLDEVAVRFRVKLLIRAASNPCPGPWDLTIILHAITVLVRMTGQGTHALDALALLQRSFSDRGVSASHVGTSSLPTFIEPFNLGLHILYCVVQSTYCP